MRVRPDYYRKQAADCRRIAIHQNGESKRLLMDVADQYDKLAEQAEQPSESSVQLEA